jgi:hypothetical protein
VLTGTAAVRLDRQQFDALSRAVRVGALDPTHPDYGILRELLPLFMCATAVTLRIRVNPPRHVRGDGQG